MRQWEDAARLARGLGELAEHEGASTFNDAFRHLVGDAARRAEEALRRARERAAAEVL